MQPTATPETNRAIELAPTVRHLVAWRVRSVQVLPDRRLRVTFIDNAAGEVDLGAMLSNPAVNGTLFEPLRDPAVFAQARVVMGAVQWPNGADLAPDAMYDGIREHGTWVLG